MSNFSKAADDIKTIASKLKQFIELSEALEKIGSVEQAARDAEAKKSLAYKETEAAYAELEKAKKKLEAAEAGIFAANVKAKDLEEAAFNKAKAIVSEAHDKAAAVEKAMQAKSKELDQKFIAATAELKNYNDEIAAKAEELAHIKAEIDAVKAKFLK